MCVCVCVCVCERVLFGELRKKRPCHGVKKRWRDVARSNAEAIGVRYDLCQDRRMWFKLHCEGVEKVSMTRQRNTCPAVQTSTFTCVCGRNFRRQGDLTRHKRFCSHCD